MNRGTYRKLWAILGAGVLTLGVVSMALAHAGASDQGILPVTTEGNITVEGGGGNDQVDCAAADAIFFDVSDFAGDGEASGTSTNGVTVDASYDETTKEVSFEVDGDGVVLIAYVKGSSAYNTYDYSGLGGVDADGHLHAPENPSGDAGLSHLILCTGEEVEETAPPTEAPTDTPVPTETPFQSVFEETDAPTDVPTDAPTETPFQSVEGDTDEPSEPDTATIGGSKDLGSPADGAWLLVVALGVLLASIVVLTPARAKVPRR